MTFNTTAVSRLYVNPVEVNALLRGPDSVVIRDLVVRATRVQLAAQRQVALGHVHGGPTNYWKGVGNLRYSIKKRIVPATGTGAPTVIVGSDDPIALIYHEGAKPHVITPRRAKVLVFWIGAEKVVTRRVSHPGTKPNRYLTDNIKYAIL